MDSWPFKYNAMENNNYRFTVIDRESQKTLCENTENIDELKNHLPDSIFTYIKEKTARGYLIAKKLVHFNRVCIIKRLK